MIILIKPWAQHRRWSYGLLAHFVKLKFFTALDGKHFDTPPFRAQKDATIPKEKNPTLKNMKRKFLVLFFTLYQFSLLCSASEIKNIVCTNERSNLHISIGFNEATQTVIINGKTINADITATEIIFVEKIDNEFLFRINRNTGQLQLSVPNSGYAYLQCSSAKKRF